MLPTVYPNKANNKIKGHKASILLKSISKVFAVDFETTLMSFSVLAALPSHIL